MTNNAILHKIYLTVIAQRARGWFVGSPCKNSRQGRCHSLGLAIPPFAEIKALLLHVKIAISINMGRGRDRMRCKRFVDTKSLTNPINKNHQHLLGDYGHVPAIFATIRLIKMMQSIQVELMHKLNAMFLRNLWKQDTRVLPLLTVGSFPKKYESFWLLYKKYCDRYIFKIVLSD